IPDTHLVERPVHCRPYQVTKTRINHGKGLAWALGIGLGTFYICNTCDDIGCWRDKVTSWLNFHTDGTSGLLTEAFLCGPQELPKSVQIDRGGAWTIGMGHATAEVDSLHLRVRLQALGEKAHQVLHIGDKFRYLRP